MVPMGRGIGLGKRFSSEDIAELDENGVDVMEMILAHMLQRAEHGGLQTELL
jgi:hypothetical protein